jgi:hypothetical protein
MPRARKQPAASRMDEIPFMRHLLLALGLRPELRIWRQNTGKVPVRDRRGKIVRVFDPGVPNGAADISGIVRKSGRRIEIETKAADGEQEPDQENWQRMIESFGGIYVLITYDESRSLDENLTAAVHQILAAAA